MPDRKPAANLEPCVFGQGNRLDEPGYTLKRTTRGGYATEEGPCIGRDCRALVESGFNVITSYCPRCDGNIEGSPKPQS